MLGDLLRCNGTGQTIPILLASDCAGGFFDVIVSNTTTLTLSSGAFTGSVGSGTSSATLTPTPSPHYHLLSNGSDWLVHNAAISRGPAIITTGTRALTAAEVFGSVVTVSGIPPFTPYTITLPSPAAVAGARFELMLDVGIPITITTPTGWTGGMSGS